MRKQELRSGMRVWCLWLSRYLYYNGRAYNAKDYEFVDIADCVVTLSESQLKDLVKK